jgi:predicted RNase H-like HicB family nuclease
MEFDDASESFVTCVPELHRMSSFGDTASEALDQTAEMICSYIESMQERGMKIPLSKAKLSELKSLVWL